MIFSSSILFSASFPVSPIYYGFYGKNYRNMQSFSKKGYHIFGAWKAMPPAKPNPLLTYLLKIVRNLSLKRYWQKGAAKRNSNYTIALQEIEACVAAPNAVEDVIEARELAHILEGFLDTLTKENRVIFLRRYWFSDSYQDIAELVGLSEKTVSVRLTRMRQKMRQYLLESGVIR